MLYFTCLLIHLKALIMLYSYFMKKKHKQKEPPTKQKHQFKTNQEKSSLAPKKTPSRNVQIQLISYKKI